MRNKGNYMGFLGSTEVRKLGVLGGWGGKGRVKNQEMEGKRRVKGSYDTGHCKKPSLCEIIRQFPCTPSPLWIIQADCLMGDQGCP